MSQDVQKTTWTGKPLEALVDAASSLSWSNIWRAGLYFMFIAEAQRLMSRLDSIIAALEKLAK